MAPCCICASKNQNCKSCECVRRREPCTNDCRKGNACNNRHSGAQPRSQSGREARKGSQKRNELSVESESDILTDTENEETKEEEERERQVTYENLQSNQNHGFTTRRYGPKDLTLTVFPGQLENVEPDGNCFFRAVSLALYNTEERHLEIRNAAIAELVDNKALYENTIEEDFEDYIVKKSMSNGNLSSWATENEINATSRKLGIDIFVWSRERRNEWCKFPSINCDHKKKYITINNDNDHFQVVHTGERPCQCLGNNVREGGQQKRKIPTVNPGKSKNDKMIWQGMDVARATEWVNSVYDEIVFWNSHNLFEPPQCRATKEMAQIMTQQIQHFNDNTPCSVFALKALMIVPHLLLQRPYQNSTIQENREALERRISLWIGNDMQKLLQEARTKQGRLEACKYSNNTEDEARRFGKLMRKGKVNPAIRMLSQDTLTGPMPITKQIRQKLQDLHPKAKNAPEAIKLSTLRDEVDDCVYDSLNASMIWKKAVKTQGGAGPSGLDARGWRTILSKKRFGKFAIDLCKAIARLARKLATEKCKDTDALTACRLIPLNKNPGVRPVGVGEVLRRVIGKCIMEIVKKDVKKAAGNLQVCAGQHAGGEAAIHAMRKIFDENEVEAVLLVDASNAFNTINREAMLHNISAKCPTFYQYVQNTYGTSANLYIGGGSKDEPGDTIKSSEGTTQGDPVAMAMYAVGLSVMLDQIKQHSDNTKQVAYADDLVGAGSISELKKWWNILEKVGPDFGYYPNASKSWLITKPECMKRAVFDFKDTTIQVTDTGQRHLGAVIGSQDYKEQYVQEKVDSWIMEIEKLSKYAKTEPHAAYTAFVFGLKHKWTYISRTIPGVGSMLQALEDSIRDKFIPAITKGHVCSDAERDLLALPPKLGGLGIINPAKIADREYHNSIQLTSALTDYICNQDTSGDICELKINQIRREITKNRQKCQEDKLQETLTHLRSMERKIQMAQETGASNWLSSLPIKAKGFSLNKQEFTDALALRYGWNVGGLPDQCSCGDPFNEEHAMICQKGGFVCMRHDEVRDITASLLREIVQDVAIEPALQPLTGETFVYKTANTASDARVDISAAGFWTRGQRAFFDIRIFDSHAPSHREQSLEAVHRKNELEKQRKYSEKIINVEHGTFTPLVFTTSGGMGPQAKRFFSRVADVMSEKKKEPKGFFTAWMRCRLSFSLLRSALLCLRGTRSKYNNNNLKNVDFEDVVLESRIMR